MNKRWQEYNQQRETSFTQLQKELSDCKDKEKLHGAQTANLEKTMQEQMHRILEDAQTHITRANQELQRANQEKDQVINTDL